MHSVCDEEPDFVKGRHHPAGALARAGVGLWFYYQRSAMWWVLHKETHRLGASRCVSI